MIKKLNCYCIIKKLFKYLYMLCHLWTMLFDLHPIQNYNILCMVGDFTFETRYEAVELRDGDKGSYLGNSVTRAVKNVNEKISEALVGMDPTLQSQIDQAMLELDRTEKKVLVIFSVT